MTGSFTLAPLPWEEDALEPAISANTISFHYHKHHKGYVDTLNKLVAKTKFAGLKLEKIVQAPAGASDAAEKNIFNNAAQVWNHDFYWRSLTPDETEPGGKLASAIARDFGMNDFLFVRYLFALGDGSNCDLLSAIEHRFQNRTNYNVTPVWTPRVRLISSA